MSKNKPYTNNARPVGFSATQQALANLKAQGVAAPTHMQLSAALQDVVKERGMQALRDRDDEGEAGEGEQPAAKGKGDAKTAAAACLAKLGDGASVDDLIRALADYSNQKNMTAFIATDGPKLPPGTIMTADQLQQILAQKGARR